MFTGIVEEIGTIGFIRHGAAGAVIGIRGGKVLEGTRIGDSIATDGVCLTVTSIDRSSGMFTVDVMPETFRRSTLGRLSPGSRVNLERAMPADGRFGGHIVSGHVDCCGRIVSVVQEDNASLVTVRVGEDIMRYIPVKGSVAVDGTSLTVAGADREHFTVSLIPHTRKSTVIGFKGPGDEVNIEVDVIARYAARLLGAETAGKGRSEGLTEAFLAENGF